MNWPFAKYVGSGNDFALFDNRKKNFPISADLIRHLCNRHYGIGADGVLLLEDSTRADFRMRIFNSDGTEAEMCGNGLRCFVQWLPTIDANENRQNFQIEVMEQLLEGEIITKQTVKISIKINKEVVWNLPIEIDKEIIHIHLINTGVPHAVVFSDQVDDIPIEKIGPKIRNHPKLQPQGTNVTFVEKRSPNQLKIRTYERGVEGETLACGTGAAAAALVLGHLLNLSGPIHVETRSKEILEIDFDLSKSGFSNITLTGPTYHIFDGEVRLPKEFTEPHSFKNIYNHTIPDSKMVSLRI